MLCYVESIRGDRVTLQVVKLIRNLLMLSDGYTAHVALSRADLRRTLRRELIDAGSLNKARVSNEADEMQKFSIYWSFKY